MTAFNDETIASFVLPPEQATLDLSNSDKNVTITDVGLRALCNNRSIVFSKVLRSLDLSRVTSITSVEPLIADLLARNDTITDINLSGCTGIAESELNELRTVLAFNKQPPLLKMHLFRMYRQARHAPMSGDEALDAAAVAEPNGAHADAPQPVAEIGAETAAAPAQPFISPPPPPLPEQKPRYVAVPLDLDEKRSHHPYDDTSVAALVGQVLLAFPVVAQQFRISSLILRNNGGVTVTSAKLLARWLTMTNALAHLDLSNTSVGSDGVWALADSLRENASLRTLLLSNVGGCEQVATVALASVLETSNSTLVHVDLTQNGIKADAVHPLALVFRTHPSLTTLAIVEGNDVDADDIRTIEFRDQALLEPRCLAAVVPALFRQEQALLRNGVSDPTVNGTLIVSLSLAYNRSSAGDAPLTDRSIEILVAALQRNRSVTAIDVSYNDVTATGFEQLCGWIGARAGGVTEVFKCAGLKLDMSAADLRRSTAEYLGPTSSPFATLKAMLASRPPLNTLDPAESPVPCAETLRHLDFSDNFVESGVRERDVFDLVHRCRALQTFEVRNLRVLSSLPPDSAEFLLGNELQTKTDIWIAAKLTKKPLLQALIETLLLQPRTNDLPSEHDGAERVETSTDSALVLVGPEVDDEAAVLISRCLKFLACEAAVANPLPFQTLKLMNNSFTNIGCDIIASAILNYSAESLPSLEAIEIVGNALIDDDGVAHFAAIPQSRTSFKRFHVAECPHITASSSWSTRSSTSNADVPAATTTVVALSDVLVTRPPTRVIADLLEYNNGTKTFQRVVEAVITAAHYGEGHTAAATAPHSQTGTAGADLSLAASAATLPAYLQHHPVVPALIRAQQQQALYESLEGVRATMARRPLSAAAVAASGSGVSASALPIPTELIVNFSQSTSERDGYVDDVVVRNALVKYWLGAPHALAAGATHYSMLDTLRINNNMVTERGLVDLLSFLTGAGRDGSASGPDGIKVVFHLRVLDVSNNLVVESPGSQLRELLPRLVRVSGRLELTSGDHRVTAGRYSPTALPFLETINISYNDFSDETVGATAAAMLLQRCEHPSVTNLVVEDIPRLQEDTRVLVRRSNALNHRHQLKQRMFEACDLMRVGPLMADGITAAPTEWLAFDFGVNTTEDHFITVCEQLADCISENGGRVKFDLFRCSCGAITSDAVRVFLPLLRICRRVDLSNNELDGATLSAVAAAIEELEDEVGVNGSLDLVELNFSGNPRIAGAAEANQLRSALRRNKSLTELNLSGSGMTALDRDDLTHYVRLNTQRSLQQLLPRLLACDMTATEVVLREPFDEVSLTAIAQAARTTPFLRTIDFGSVGRTALQLETSTPGREAQRRFDLAWAELCAALAENSQLSTLRFTHASLSNHHISTLFTVALKDCHSRVETLDLRGNPGVKLLLEAGDDVLAVAARFGEHRCERENAILMSPLVAQSHSPAGATFASFQQRLAQHHSSAQYLGVDGSSVMSPLRTGHSPLPALASPDVTMEVPEAFVAVAATPDSHARALHVVDSPPHASVRHLHDVVTRVLDFHNESLAHLLMDELDVQNSAGAGNAITADAQADATRCVRLAAARNNRHSPTVKRDLITLQRANAELLRLRRGFAKDVPHRDHVVPIGRETPRSIVMDVVWHGQDVDDEALRMLCDALRELLDHCSSRVYYSDDSVSYLSSLEITEIDLRGNPRITEAAALPLSALLATLMAYTHRIPSEFPLRFSMLRLDHSGNQPSDQLGASLHRTLYDTPYLLLSCLGSRLLAGYEKQLTFMSRCNEEPLRFREVLINFVDSPPASAIFAYFPTDVEREATTTPDNQRDTLHMRPEPPTPSGTGAAAATPVRAPVRSAATTTAATNGVQAAATTPPRKVSAATPLSTRRQQQLTEQRSATGGLLPLAETDHHLRKQRGFRLTDRSIELLVDRLTTTPTGRHMTLRKLILHDNAITSRGFGLLVRALCATVTLLSGGDDGAAGLSSSATRRAIEHIDLRGNALDDECLDDLCSLLDSKGASLEHVDLSDNHLTAAVVPPLLEKLFNSGQLRRTVRFFDVSSSSSKLMPVSASLKLKLAAQLYSKGVDVELLGWGVLRSANNSAVFSQFVNKEKLLHAAPSEYTLAEVPVATVAGCDGVFDMTKRVHSPSAAPMLLTLCLHTAFTRGITVLNLSHSGISSFEKTGFFLRHRDQVVGSTADDDDTEYYSMCDVLVDFVVACETLVHLNLSHNKLSLRRVIAPLMIDAIRVKRTIETVDVTFNDDPATDGQDPMSAFALARLIDDDLMPKNKVLQRVVVGPVSADEAPQVESLTAAIRDHRITLLVEQPIVA